MGIKRGVSLYSYQQEAFFRRMDWKDMIHEVHDNLHADGIEIIDEMTIRDYPFPSDAFLDAWNEEMALYHMKAVTMDVFLDVHQFRDHVMTHEEAADRLKRDIRIAAGMGFENVRCLCLVPIDVIEMALPTAEKYNVRIGKEIHAPLSIKPGMSFRYEEDLKLDPRSVDQIIELADRTGSKHVGLVPDFGIFQYRPTEVMLDYMRRQNGAEMIDFILEEGKRRTPEEIRDELDRRYPGHTMKDLKEIHSLLSAEMTSQPEDLKDILPYIVSIHGKFYNMSEVEGRPGHYEDKSIDYADPIRVLKECGFDGYINSEYEGQRYQQDGGIEELADEVAQVRMHHSMLRDLIGE